MKIAFKKISQTPSTFDLKSGDIGFVGDFRREDELISIIATLKGECKLICDRCGDDFMEMIDEELKLFVSDGYYEGDELDVIESHSGLVDFDEIAESEIEAFKSEYHYCKKCKKLGE